MDEESLTSGLAEDLDGHFEPLVRAFADRLYAFALRLSGSPAEADEIAQDAFVRAYRALGGYPAERIRALAVRPWLYRITLNVFRNRVRGQAPRVTSLDGLLEPEGDGVPWEPAAAPEERPEPLAIGAETRAELAALVAALPERYRVAVVLRHVEDLGYAEIAGLLGQPVGTVKANVHRGVRLLREALAAQPVEVLR